MTSLTLGVVVDRSGSMAGIWDEVVGGLDDMVEKQAQEGMTTVVPLVFDNEIDVLPVIMNAETQTIPDEIRPRGMTRLNDAIIRGVEEAEKYESDKTLIMVLTDGFENASESNSEQVKKIVEEKTDEGWEFVFVGANQDEVLEAGKRGIGTSVSWDQSVDGTTRAYAATTQHVSTYRNS